jgi:hypothetical protein
MDVDLRGVEVGVAQPLPELERRDALLGLMGSEGVAKGMAAAKISPKIGVI